MDVSDETAERARNEHEPVEPLRTANDTEADEWLHGYAAGYKGLDVQEPRKHVVAYLRGFIAGLKAAR